MPKGRKSLDLSGKTFNYLTAISSPTPGKWYCSCFCGNFVTVRTHSLIKGTTKSCGCYKTIVNKQLAKNMNKSRGKAGKRKCKRCKKIFIRLKGEIFLICERCRTHCKRCDKELTGENINPSRRLNQYECKYCIAERVRLTTNKERARDYDLVRNYGITLFEYNQIFAAQNNVCFICKSPPKTKNLAVDHKHQKKESRRSSFEKRHMVRGILCWPCNSAIEKFKDSPELLRNAAEYLEKWPAQEILQKGVIK